jgi:hypothetical protein
MTRLAPSLRADTFGLGMGFRGDAQWLAVF